MGPIHLANSIRTLQKYWLVSIDIEAGCWVFNFYLKLVKSSGIRAITSLIFKA